MQLKTFSKVFFLLFACIFLLGTVFAVDFAHAIGIDNEYDIKRFLVIGFVWFSSLGLCFVKHVEFIRFSTVTKLMCMIFFTLAIISALINQHLFWGMVEIANIVLLITVFLLFTTCIRALESETVHFGVYVSALLFSVFTLVKYILFLIFSYLDAQNFDIHGLISGYVNVRFFNQLQVMIIPMLFLPFFKQNLAKFRTGTFIVIALHWMVLLQTEARGGMLSLILAVTLLSCFLCKENRRSFIYPLLQTMLVGICLWIVFIIIIPYWLMDSANFQIRTSSSGRIDLWLYVLTSIPDSLWLGFGPMSFAWAEGKPLLNAHPHNAIVQLLYEYGVITCILGSAWVFSRMYNRLNILKQAKNISIMPIVYAVLSGLIYSLFSGVAVMPFAQLLFVFLLVIQIQDGSRNINQVAVSVRVMLFLSVTLISCFFLCSYKHLELNTALFPRIWVNGLLSR
ncbi:O-antigen ligase family protein [Shewanella sp. HL-SH8]|uniref:O-antigen ligase family protein n=1 Tax=Shewanella sp. HL-SH8 TaxID=3436242 RepID=UPI003EB9EA53